MGKIRAFFLKLWRPSSDGSYEPPPISENEVEAKRQHDLQMGRLKVAMESRKRIEDSTYKISKEFEKA